MTMMNESPTGEPTATAAEMAPPPEHMRLLCCSSCSCDDRHGDLCSPSSSPDELMMAKLGGGTSSALGPLPASTVAAALVEDDAYYCTTTAAAGRRGDCCFESCIDGSNSNHSGSEADSKPPFLGRNGPATCSNDNSQHAAPAVVEPEPSAAAAPSASASAHDDSPAAMVRRPTPRTVRQIVQHRPIPKRAVESFYDEAHRDDGIEGMEVHVAAAEAQLWHKKWASCHDETPSLHGYQKTPAAAAEAAAPSGEAGAEEAQKPLDHYAFHIEDMLPPGVTVDDLEFDRMRGAHNPSPTFMVTDDPRPFYVVDDAPFERFVDTEDIDSDDDEDDDGEEEVIDDIMLWIAKEQRKDEARRQRRNNKRRAPTGDAPIPSSIGVPEGPKSLQDRQEDQHLHLVRPVAVRICKPAAPTPKYPPPFVMPFSPPSSPSDRRDRSRAPTSPLTTCSDEDEDSYSSSSEVFQPNNKRRNIMRRGSSLSRRGSAEDDDDDEGVVAAAPKGGDGNIFTPNIRDDLQQQGYQTQQVRAAAVNVVQADSDEIAVEPEQQEPVEPEIVAQARDGLLKALASSAGATDAEEFGDCLDVLEGAYGQSAKDVRHPKQGSDDEGLWLTLTKPTFFGQVGSNDAGDPMYTLGRMAFDMFSPTNLVVSLQGNFNVVESCLDADAAQAVPKGLLEEVKQQPHLLRSYNIVAAFTIEPPQAQFPDAPNKDVARPIRGIMTTYGYTLPDPNTPNRQSVWITGGRIEPNNDRQDLEDWKRLFTLHPPKHTFGQKAKLLAVKWLMGAETDKCQSMAEDGSLEYAFTRPLGGHGMAYVDTLYVDSSLRVVRGHRGTVFVFTKLPDGGRAAHDLAHSK